jgi:hypothetical protein
MQHSALAVFCLLGTMQGALVRIDALSRVLDETIRCGGGLQPAVDPFEEYEANFPLNHAKTLAGSRLGHSDTSACPRKIHFFEYGDDQFKIMNFHLSGTALLSVHVQNRDGRLRIFDAGIFFLRTKSGTTDILPSDRPTCEATVDAETESPTSKKALDRTHFLKQGKRMECGSTLPDKS